MNLGMAQQLFVEGAGVSPWQRRGKAADWPMLRRLAANETISSIQLALAETLVPEGSEAAAAFICALVGAAEAGHLCLSIDQARIVPAVADIWTLSAHDELALSQLIMKGSREIPDPLLACVDTTPEPQTPLCRQGNRFYLQKHWAYESLFLQQWIRLSTAQVYPEVEAPPSAALTGLQPEQVSAVVKGCHNSCTLITGGPGTGKTFTAGHLLKALWNGLTAEQRRHFQIALAAPTGKAAANLEASVQRITADIAGFPLLKGQTLHRLLGIRDSAIPKNAGMLSHDLVLVDESSMIDLRMMALLLTSIKAGARLILMGDAQQLPPVEAGGLFADLVEAHKGQQAVVQLTHCLRTESTEILGWTSAIRNGDLSQLQAQGLKPLALEDTPKLLRHVGSYLTGEPTDLNDPSALMQHLRQFCILSPIRHGPWGVEAINRLLFSHRSGRTTLPILIRTNDPKQELFNGDIGLLVLQDPRSDRLVSSGNYALFPRPDGIRRLSTLALPAFELAYCLSVHKSQGSEFDHVLLLLPDDAAHFGRELLYTAATRARKKLEICASDRVLEQMLKRTGQRHSGILARLELIQNGL